MKKVIFFALVLATAVAANAQSKTGKDIQFSGGVRFGLPVGNFHYSQSIGIGAELQAEYRLSPMASLTGTTGFTNFIGKSASYYDYGYKYPAVGYIPILVGVRAYPSEKSFCWCAGWLRHLNRWRQRWRFQPGAASGLQC